jgi:hypothetical protein
MILNARENFIPKRALVSNNKASSYFHKLDIFCTNLLFEDAIFDTYMQSDKYSHFVTDS